MRKLDLQSLKKHYRDNEHEDRALREMVAELLGGVLKLSDIAYTKGKVVLVAANKVIAQEVFFRKSELEAKIKKEIVIR